MKLSMPSSIQPAQAAQKPVICCAHSFVRPPPLPWIVSPCRPGWPAVRSQARKQFFFEKKNQKLLFLRYAPAESSATAETKPSCFFFSKKKGLSYAALLACFALRGAASASTSAERATRPVLTKASWFASMLPGS